MTASNATFDKRYLAWIRTLPCLACERAGIEQATRTEAHHAGPRAYGTKVPNSQAVPLCREHHREGKHAVHVIGKRFWTANSIDMASEIERLNSEWESEAGI